VTRADITSWVHLDDVFGDGVVEHEFAVAHCLRQQRSLEHLAQRSEIEQRVGRDRPFVGAIGPTIIEEQRAALDAQSHGDAAGTIGRHGRRDVSRDGPLRVAVGADRRAGDQCRHYRD
jgi:hypothetical protein